MRRHMSEPTKNLDSCENDCLFHAIPIGTACCMCECCSKLIRLYLHSYTVLEAFFVSDNLVDMIIQSFIVISIIHHHQKGNDHSLVQQGAVCIQHLQSPGLHAQLRQVNKVSNCISCSMDWSYLVPQPHWFCPQWLSARRVVFYKIAARLEGQSANIR